MLLPGTRLGAYEIVGLLGAGGMGEVYKAKDLKLGREVAVKVLPAAFAEDAERLKRFEQEARAAGALNHPNITMVFELGTHEGSPYLAMELLEGQSLRALAGNGPLPAAQVAELGEQVAAGLAAAHERGIVHRDLKPENLFLTRDGVVKILDFGLAKRSLIGGEDATASMGNLTASGTVMGTLSYMSPEQATGKPVDFRSDQFSLGIVLYELLSGRKPFGGDSMAETLAAIVRDDPAPLEALSLGIPSGLAAIVQRCLAKEPKERYRSTRELAKQLSVARMHASTGGTAATGYQQVQVGAATHTRIRAYLAGGAAALVLAAAGLLLWKPWRPSTGAKRIPVVLALPATVLGAPESAFLTDAIPVALSTRLAEVEGLDTKLPPTSLQVEHVKGDLARITEAYKADRLVLSTVTAQGENLVLDVKLVDAATRKVRWAQRFQGTRGSYNAMLEEAASGLLRSLLPSGAGRLGKAAFRSEVELALREGKYFQQRYINKKEPRDFDQALAAFRRAEALEPSSAMLTAEVAHLYEQQYRHTRDPKALAEAERWQARALELDPRCGKAWWVRSWIETNRPKADIATILECTFKAIRYAPGESATFVDFALSAPTEAFAVAAGQRAIELDPLDPAGYFVLAIRLSGPGRAEQGLAYAERGLRVEPANGELLWAKFLCLFQAGRFDEAKRIYPEPGASGNLRLRHFLMAGDTAGARNFAQSRIAKWRTTESGADDWSNRMAFMGALFPRLGMDEEYLWLLAKITEVGLPPGLDWFFSDPDARKFRGDPRVVKAFAAARTSARLWLEHADAAKARGEFPKEFEPPLAELRELVNRNP